MTIANILRYGAKAPLSEAIPLRAGPLSLIYENGDLRYICLGEREVIRRIYIALRDHNWGTVPNILTNVRMEIGDDSFCIEYEVKNQRAEIDFGWSAKITGSMDGTINFTFEGEAHTAFRRNRLGFCILHPIQECAGAACTLEHTDGSHTKTHFPQLVAPQIYVNGLPTPHLPFANLRAMTHQVLPDIWAELRFDGEIFELEDQRNWIDASFKTYCTPLALPFPVEIAQGTLIHQQIRLSLQGKIEPKISDFTRITQVDWHADATRHPLPPLGVSTASHGQALTAQEVERLRALRLSHLRLELNLSRADWRTRLEQIHLESQALELPLAITLILSEAGEAELRALADALTEIEPRLAAWLLWHQDELVTNESWVQLARLILSPYDPSVPIGAGSKANFAELNRAWPDASQLDFISFTANPQVHAYDNASVMETPAALPAILATAHERSGGKPIALNPLTLRQQFNPVATGSEIPPPPGELPSKVDPRQMSLFATGWTLACLKHLAESGRLHHLTLYETTGWLGLMEHEVGSPLPDKFPSVGGAVFPIYHLLAILGAWRGSQVIPLVSSKPLAIEALGLEKDRQRRILLANLTDHSQTVRLPDGAALVRVLDEQNVEALALAPEQFSLQLGKPLTNQSLTLLPYALACVEYQGTE